MSLKDYFQKFTTETQLTLVGPMVIAPLKLQDPVVFVDGGNRARKSRIGFAIGDGDSTVGSLDERLPSRKDYSDLQAVLREIPDHFTEIQMMGFAGGRKDHELINWGEVHHFLNRRQAKRVRVLMDSVVAAYARGIWELEVDGVFSVVVFEKTLLSIDGACDYPLQNQELEAVSSHGLSNSGQGPITIKSAWPFFVFHNKA